MYSKLWTQKINTGKDVKTCKSYHWPHEPAVHGWTVEDDGVLLVVAGVGGNRHNGVDPSRQFREPYKLKYSETLELAPSEKGGKNGEGEDIAIMVLIPAGSSENLTNSKYSETFKISTKGYER